MTPRAQLAREKRADAKRHRARERAHMHSLRYAIRHGLYDMAFRELMWAFQQSTIADLKERTQDVNDLDRTAKRCHGGAL